MESKANSHLIQSQTTRKKVSESGKLCLVSANIYDNDAVVPYGVVYDRASERSGQDRHCYFSEATAPQPQADAPAFQGPETRL